MTTESRVQEAERGILVQLTVPGMPVGSPGMEQGPRQDPYDVLMTTDESRVAVFARYGGPQG